MIQGSVGNGGRNIADDVTTVQRLLKTKGFDPGAVDGLCGPATIAAIRRFQARFMTSPDGLISPGMRTWWELSSTTPQAGGLPAVAQWTGDSSKWSQDQKLRSMTPTLRPLVQAVIGGLALRGFQPTIFFGWRSVAVQLELFRQGNSKVKFSFHNAQQKDGTPNSYAADIIDTRYAWSKEAETSGFWKALGEEAKKQGLYWGGDWSDFRDWAHVQLVPNIQLAQVKRDSGL